MEEGNVSEVPTTVAAQQEDVPIIESSTTAPNIEDTIRTTENEEEVNEMPPTLAAQQEGLEGEEAPITESLTTAPIIDDMQLTTTSIVTTAAGTESSSKGHRRAISKIDAANEFVYGHVERSWTRPDRRPSIDLTVTFRPNRTHTMRQSCIMKRALTEEGEKSAREETRSSSESENIDPVTARPVPKSTYDGPKIQVRDTTSSKFRYLYNRKPPGVKVYFKRANAVEKKRPPFVVSIHT